MQTDSEKIRLIPELMRTVAQLHKIIVTGDVEHGTPGLLESLRQMNQTLNDIRQKQINFTELEKRVSEIEERHKIMDAQRARIDEQKKKWDSYKLAVFGTLFANIVMMLMQLVGL